MYELTVEGANRGGGNARISGNSSREWTQGGGGGGGGGVLTQGVPAPNAAAAAVGKDVPEWADATATGGGPNGAPAAGFLGSGAVPRLTASERSVVFGDSSDRDTAVDRKMATASAQQAAGGFFGLAPGGGGMDDARSSKLIGALESDGENTNLGGGIDDAVDPPLHQRNQHAEPTAEPTAEPGRRRPRARSRTRRGFTSTPAARTRARLSAPSSSSGTTRVTSRWICRFAPRMRRRRCRSFPSPRCWSAAGGTRARGSRRRCARSTRPR